MQDLKPGLVCAIITLASITGFIFTKQESLIALAGTATGGYFGYYQQDKR